MHQVRLDSTKKNELFKRTEFASCVYVRGLCRQVKKGASTYNCYKYEDVNCELVLKGSTLVWIDFEY